MPFYPSRQRDDGYDITDFYGVDGRLGTPGDFVELIRTAADRGIRVIADLVMNHTSAEHPWFAAGRDRSSPYHDFYVWADEKPAEKPGDVVFPDREDSNWAYDPKARQWYLHRFYSHQPDLNVANPEVRDEIAQVVGYWLTQGLAGFRVDAVPFMLEPIGMPEGALHDPHELLRDLRRFIGRRRGDAILMGEVNLPPDQQRAFFGDEDGDELHMVLSFVINQAMYLSLARGDATPLRDALAALPAIPEDCQWANFVRNHDELTLDKLAEDERAEVFAAFGPEEELQLYGRGLRRRLPTMVGGDERRIRMLYSLAFALPGTPVLFYGEEIGMAENLEIPGRYSVRAPMQWSADRHGGFSTAEDADALCRPVVAAEGWGPERVNVAAQRRDPGSLLNWMERLDPPPPRVPRARLGARRGARRRPVRRALPPRRLGREHRARAALVRRPPARGARRARAGGRAGRRPLRRRERDAARTARSPSRSTPTAPAGSACAATASASRRSSIGSALRRFLRRGHARTGRVGGIGRRAGARLFGVRGGAGAGLRPVHDAELPRGGADRPAGARDQPRRPRRDDGGVRPLPARGRRGQPARDERRGRHLRAGPPAALRDRRAPRAGDERRPRGGARERREADGPAHERVAGGADRRRRTRRSCGSPPTCTAARRAAPTRRCACSTSSPTAPTAPPSGSSTRRSS